MTLLSIPPVFEKYLNLPEFARNIYWTRSDKAAPVPGIVYGMIPLHLLGSQKIKSLRVTGLNPAGGTCHVSIWENYARDGTFRRSIVGAFPAGTPFDTLVVPPGGYYVTNPTDYNYAIWAYASGIGKEIQLFNIQIEAMPIG